MKTRTDYFTAAVLALAVTLLLSALLPSRAFADRVIFWNQFVIDRSAVIAQGSVAKDGALMFEFVIAQGMGGYNWKFICKDKIEAQQLYAKVLPALVTYLDKEQYIHPATFFQAQGFTQCTQQ
jgi:hypothetical protein